MNEPTRQIFGNATDNAAHGVRSFAIVVNPDAGGERKRFVALVAARLTENGRDVTIDDATAQGRIYVCAKTTDADALLVAGGDGSVNEAVRGLLDRAGRRPVLGIIPQGTVNVLAKELGLPHTPEALARMFLDGATAALHVGLVNGRPFVLMASAGLDATVVKNVDLGLKKKVGRAAYLVGLVKALLQGGAPDVIAETDAGDIRAKCVIVTKSKYYGGRFVIDRNADVTRPGLSLIALRDISLPALIAAIRYFATGKMDASGRIVKRTVERVAFNYADIATQIDGDYFGEAPIEIRESSEALTVFAPAQPTAARIS